MFVETALSYSYNKIQLDKSTCFQVQTKLRAKSIVDWQLNVTTKWHRQLPLGKRIDIWRTGKYLGAWPVPPVLRFSKVLQMHQEPSVHSVLPRSLILPRFSLIRYGIVLSCIIVSSLIFFRVHNRFLITFIRFFSHTTSCAALSTVPHRPLRNLNTRWFLSTSSNRTLIALLPFDFSECNYSFVNTGMGELFIRQPSIMGGGPTESTFGFTLKFFSVSSSSLPAFVVKEPLILSVDQRER